MRIRTFPWFSKGLLGLALAALAVVGARAQDLKSFEQRITTKMLPNGLTIVICERPEAPVFSYSTFIDAGAEHATRRRCLLGRRAVRVRYPFASIGERRRRGEH